MRLLAIILWASAALSQAAETAAGRWEGVGGIFSTPLVMNGVVYFGSTDGNLYAIE